MFCGKIHLLSSIRPNAKRVKSDLEASGWQTEKFTSIESATRHVNYPSIILIEDRGDNISELFTYMEGQAQFRCVCAFSETSNPHDIVNAMHLGVTDYFKFSFRYDDIGDRMQRIWETGSLEAARRTKRTNAMNSIRNMSRRESQVLEYYSQGLSTDDISHALKISKRTIEIHRRNIKKRLKVDNFYLALRLAEQARM